MCCTYGGQKRVSEPSGTVCVIMHCWELNWGPQEEEVLLTTQPPPIPA